MAARPERSTAKPKMKASKAAPAVHSTPKPVSKSPPKGPPKSPAKVTTPKPPAVKPASKAPVVEKSPAPKASKAPVAEKAASKAPAAKAPAAKAAPAKGVALKTPAPGKVEPASKPLSKPTQGKGSAKPLPGKASGKGALVKPGSGKATRVIRDRVTRPLPPPTPKPRTLEERSHTVEERLVKATEGFRKAYFERFDMSWIFHDAALEGVVYTEQELRTALDPTVTVLPDSSLQPICDEIRRHREAIAYCRDQATKKRQPVTGDMIKKIFLILHPEEGDLKSVKYRKEIPQHRLYFHEYAAPDKIASKVRQVVEWVNDPETRKVRGSIRIAGRAHYDLLRAFPFAIDSGRVARLFMNLLLMRAGYPPAIMHSTDRQKYYEALKGSAITINNMVQEAIENALSSIEKLLDEHETRTRSFLPRAR